ncbi:intermembrane transport protein PqiB [Erwinia sp. E_sp_B04_7]|uniref:intermembrane transport protein PqiB n=1 Tax=unclassified Erwinia TaxID=2622719 RepID=UPI0030D04827
MTKDYHGIATVDEIKRWSPVWIIPVVTLLIGGWILYYHFSHLGPEVTLITENAEGIQAGKTTIRSRSIEIGHIESATLTDDLHHVEIKARLNTGMEKLLFADTLFWVVKPQVGREGVTGLGTLLSGAYINLQPGSQGKQPQHYTLSDAPPRAAANAKGIRITLGSNKAGQLSPGDPVLFRGYRVGTVESSLLDTDKRMMVYQLFISAPYDQLVTTHVRFWKESGIAVDMSASGMRVEMGSLTTLFSGGVSFDIPEGWTAGEKAVNRAEYRLFDDRGSIQDSLYTAHIDFLLFFSSSVRGLQAGAPVEFRGIRLGTVAKMPFFLPDVPQDLKTHYRVPVLIHIEPERFISGMNQGFQVEQRLKEAIKRGLRATLKTGNLLTGSLYVELDFYDNAEPYQGALQVAGYEVIPTLNSGLGQVQQKLIAVLDKINDLPLNPVLTEATGTLKQSHRTLRELQVTLKNVNKLIASPGMKKLPDETQQTLRELNRSLKGLQPGSPAYIRLVANMQKLDQVLRELQPVLKTLNSKSNALILQAPPGEDPQPEKAKR